MAPIKRLVLLVLLTLAAVSVPAYAHPGGHSFGPPATKDEIKANAAKVLNGLVENGKLDKSWKDLVVDEPKTVELGATAVSGWIATAKNPRESDKTKQTLYMFFALTGEVLGANFTGK